MGLHFYIAQVSFERDCGLVHYAMVRHEGMIYVDWIVVMV